MSALLQDFVDLSYEFKKLCSILFVRCSLAQLSNASTVIDAHPFASQSRECEGQLKFRCWNDQFWSRRLGRLARSRRQRLVCFAISMRGLSIRSPSQVLRPPIVFGADRFQPITHGSLASVSSPNCWRF